MLKPREYFTMVFNKSDGGFMRGRSVRDIKLEVTECGNFTVDILQLIEEACSIA